MAKQQEEASSDAMLTRIGQAVMLHRGGDREEARNRLGELWQEIGADGDALHHCTLAHYLADTQDDPADELAWDLRALTAADRLMRGRGEEASTSEEAVGEGHAARSGDAAERAARPVAEPELHLPTDHAGAPLGEALGPTGDAGAPGEEGGQLGEEQAQAMRQERVAAVRGFYPSLHLNLAADYVKLGRPDAARAQLDLAKAASGVLADDPYGNGVRAAIGRMELRLSGAPDEHAPPPEHRPRP
uniref:hypothetical protein n=1 Tax=Streptomyces zagrosensis TaxID=1042984 RepID=UPI0035E433EE